VIVFTCIWVKTRVMKFYAALNFTSVHKLTNFEIKSVLAAIKVATLQ